MLDNYEIKTRPKLDLNRERDNILLKSKELNRMILNRDNSLDPYLSKQFVFENILSNKDSFVENNNQSDSISKTPTQINLKFE